MSEPAPSWQRPPLQPGHQLSMVHGATSPRRVGPLALQIEQESRNSPGWPEYLNDPTFSGAVIAWARAEAVVSLLWTYLAERDLDAALDDVTKMESEEVREKGTGRVKRSATTRRTNSALSHWERAERAAANHRARLGLDPTSRANLSKALAVTAVQASIAQMTNGGAELVAQARAAGALGAGDETS